MSRSASSVRLDNMTHFSWGDDIQKKIEESRSSLGVLTFWQDFRESVLAYIEAANREFDKTPVGFQISDDGEALQISLDLFDLQIRHSSMTGEVFYAFKSELLHQLRANQPLICRDGVFKPNDRGIDIVPEITYFDDTDLRVKSLEALTQDQLRDWPMYDRLARWCLEMLIDGDREVCKSYYDARPKRVLYGLP